jgi:hypothetical protein
MRAMINAQFAIFVPTPPCVGDHGEDDPWAGLPRLLTRPGGRLLSEAGDGSEASVTAEGHARNRRRKLSVFEQEDDELVSREEEEEEGEQERKEEEEEDDDDSLVSREEEEEEGEQEGTLPFWQEQEQGDHDAQPQPEQPEQPRSPPQPLQPLQPLKVEPAASAARKRPRSAGCAPAGWTLEYGLPRHESGYESSFVVSVIEEAR